MKKIKAKKEMIKEGISKAHLQELNTIFSCEDCTYFMPAQEACNLGHKTAPHRRDEQMRLFNELGKMKFCRFLEID